jgi:hypothetical protein
MPPKLLTTIVLCLAGLLGLFFGVSLALVLLS